MFKLCIVTNSHLQCIPLPQTPLQTEILSFFLNKLCNMSYEYLTTNKEKYLK